LVLNLGLVVLVAGVAHHHGHQVATPHPYPHRKALTASLAHRMTVVAVVVKVLRRLLATVVLGLIGHCGVEKLRLQSITVVAVADRVVVGQAGRAE
jgi:hypothetical protein